jgi:ADP-heptose:LPS heptosyltransferase
MLENAHSVYSFVSDEGDAWSANVRRIQPEIQLHTIRPRPADDESFAGHVTQYLGDQLAGTPAVKGALDQIMRSVATRGVGYKRSPEGTVCVHPGAGSDQKTWPSKQFVQLVRKLVKDRRHVRVLIGEVERERLPKEDLDHFAAVAEVVEPRTYVELLDYLGRADALVCNDTGPGHLAGIIGTPTFSIFGPASNVDRWRPIGPHVHVKTTDDLDHLSADEVAKWVEGAT